MVSATKRKLIASLVVYCIQKNKTKKKKRSVWVRNWIANRESNATAQNLLEDLRSEDPIAFKQFLGLSPCLFDDLLIKVSPYIQKNTTNMRNPICAKTKLMLTMRFLVTGDTFRSLAFYFRIPHNTISSIVPETCVAIHSVLKNDYLQVSIR